MIIAAVETVISVLLVLGFLLQILHQGLFRTYTTILASLSQLVVGLFVGSILAIPTVIRAVVKAGVVLVVSITLIFVYTFTLVVPFVGNKTKNIEKRLKNSTAVLYFKSQVRQMRDLMIRIVAEEDDRDLDYSEPDMYRGDLTQVKQDAKRKLELGETVLSIILGILLILTNAIGYSLLQQTIYLLPVSTLIEIWLLVISVSIIYRTSILEFLAYPSDYDFESIETMDSALSYQKAVSLVEFIQGLTFILMLMFSISRVKRDTIEDALRAKYTDEPWLRFTWEKLVNEH